MSQSPQIGSMFRTDPGFSDLAGPRPSQSPQIGSMFRTHGSQLTRGGATMSQSPQIGSMFRTNTPSRPHSGATFVAIPSNRVNVPDGSHRPHVLITTKSRNPLKSGQCSGRETEVEAAWLKNVVAIPSNRVNVPDTTSSGCLAPAWRVAIPSNRVNVPDGGGQ